MSRDILKQIYCFFALLCCLQPLMAQTNIHLTDSRADSVIHGLYDPVEYLATTIRNHPTDILPDLVAQVSPDSLRSTLEMLSSFRNRNTGSDTLSQVTGIGAARRWAWSRFEQISAQNEDRLIPAYLQFDRITCGMDQHRNVVAVLPGMDSSLKDIVLIEAHIDSRCEGLCDTACVAYGADDNGSGTALVLELARVLSRYSFNHTVVFMLTIGEEQGLFGAEAFAEWAKAEGIAIRGVFNNDVVGGIYCGQTSSPPSCPGAGDVDSLNLRMFSYGNYNSPHKSLARWIKLEYEEEIRAMVPVAMDLHVMAGEDRVGRGGDHIPFRQNQYAAMRFTCANEHGDAGVGVGYVDHQHTSADSLGVDTDNNGTIDSLWVDFNYLARNAVINGMSVTLSAIGPETPETFTATALEGAAAIEIIDPGNYPAWRVGVRTVDHDFDSVYTLTSPVDTIYGLSGGTTVFSVAAVDTNGIESHFSYETNANIPQDREPSTVSKGLELLQNRPNPFDEQCTIGVMVHEAQRESKAFILIRDLQGREISRLPIDLKPGMNEVNYHHGFHATGAYLYSLEVDGEVVSTRRMIFNN